MIYLKYFESNNEIDSICKRYGIKRYRINPDGSIDVEGDVDLNNEYLTKLPIKFGMVTGNFICSFNQLTSLSGCPNHVDGYFECSNNQLTSLSGGPNMVDGYFSCNRNKLTSLSGSPSHIGDGFYCDFNQLTSLEGGPSHVNLYSCSSNQLTSLIGAPKRVNSFECSYNQLETLEYMPAIINAHFFCRSNKLKNLLTLKSDIRGDIYLDNNPLPLEIINNKKYIKEIIKFQNDYLIWNKDGTLNRENFQELINDL